MRITIAPGRSPLVAKWRPEAHFATRGGRSGELRLLDSLNEMRMRRINQGGRPSGLVALSGGRRKRSAAGRRGVAGGARDQAIRSC